MFPVVIRYWSHFWTVDLCTPKKWPSPKAGKNGHINLQGWKTRLQAFTEKWERVFPTSTNWEIHMCILVMFVGADKFLEFFLDLNFLVCILTWYLPMRTKHFCNLIFETLFVALFWRDVVLTCWYGHKFPHCSLFTCFIQWKMAPYYSKTV